MKRLCCLLGLAAVLGGCGDPDLDDPETLDRILAEAVEKDETQVRTSGEKGLVYLINKQTPYSGWVKRMYSSGQVRNLLEIHEGLKHGVFVAWDENGKKLGETTYKNGKQDGLEVSWYDNGQKLGEATYKNGKKEGSFRRWSENGKLIRETTYKNGKKISEKEF